MKNTKAILMLFVAVAFGLGAAVYATGLVSQQANIDAGQLVVAAVDIPLGSKINPQMLTTTNWPATSIPPGSFKDLKEVQDRVMKTSVVRGEPIMEAKLAPVGSLGGLSAVISEGKRAMTVRVNDVVGVAGFALPGTYVDVMVSAQQERVGNSSEKRHISKTVLENVLVLAIAQEAGRDDTKPKVVNAVTLELTPQDSEKLDLARSIGTLSLVLRNQLDKEAVKTAGTTRNELFGIEAPVKTVAAPAEKPKARRVIVQAAAKPEQGPCVEIIQNGSKVNTCF